MDLEEIEKYRLKKDVENGIVKWDYNGLYGNKDFFGTRKDWNNTLFDKIDEIVNYIFRNENRELNTIFISPEVCKLIDDMRMFSFDKKIINNKRYIFGKLSSRFEVVVDCNLPIGKLFILDIKKEKIKNIEVEEIVSLVDGNIEIKVINLLKEFREKIKTRVYNFNLPDDLREYLREKSKLNKSNISQEIINLILDDFRDKDVNIKLTFDNMKKKYYGVKSNIYFSKVVNGLLEEDFYLGGGDLKNISLNLVSSADVYYKDELIIKKGGLIPFYHQCQKWHEEQFVDGYAKVILDFRPSGVFGSNFDINNINDGNSNFGEDFKIEITPVY